MITQAMIYKPKKVATRLGTFGEVLYALAPKSVDVILNTAFKLFPESSAAKGEKKKDEAGLDRGRRVRAPDARRALVARGPQSARAQAQLLGLGLRGRAALARGAARARRRASARTSGFGDGEVEVPVAARGRRAAARRGSSRRRRSPTSARPTPHDRASHAYGKAYRDIVRAFRGRFDHAPDVVAFPARRARGGGAARVVRGARRGGDPVRRRHERRRRRRGRASATPTRARSRSTCGGSTACSRSTASRARRGSRRARPGPALEDQLREHGLTLRHFPQSFELSTLGGWIATRAGGHFATLYTHIDDLVESVRAVTPTGDVREPAPARARAPARAPTGCCSARRASSA